MRGTREVAGWGILSQTDAFETKYGILHSEVTGVIPEGERSNPGESIVTSATVYIS
jgi:hypothetical protein